MNVFDLFIYVLTNIIKMQEYIYCFGILLVIVTFEYVKRMMKCY